MSDTSELAGGVAIVTGGSRGIGLGIARELARAGARVAVVARDGERAAAAATFPMGARARRPFAPSNPDRVP